MNVKRVAQSGPLAGSVVQLPTWSDIVHPKAIHSLDAYYLYTLEFLDVPNKNRPVFVQWQMDHGIYVDDRVRPVGLAARENVNVES